MATTTYLKQRGFTIIELILVIVITGILSVVALPRMFNFGKQARKTVILSVQGSLTTSIQLAYSQWLALGQPNVIQIGSNYFWVGTIGYPHNVTVANATAATNLDSTGCKDLWDNLLQGPPNADTTTGCAANNGCTFEVNYNNNLCNFTDRDENYITYDPITGNVAYELAN